MTIRVGRVRSRSDWGCDRGCLAGSASNCLFAVRILLVPRTTLKTAYGFQPFAVLLPVAKGDSLPLAPHSMRFTQWLVVVCNGGVKERTEKNSLDRLSTPGNHFFHKSLLFSLINYSCRLRLCFFVRSRKRLRHSTLYFPRHRSTGYFFSVFTIFARILSLKSRLSELHNASR